MRIFTFHPQIPNYPKAKFPGVVVFSEIYQGENFIYPESSALNGSVLLKIHLTPPSK